MCNKFVWNFKRKICCLLLDLSLAEQYMSMIFAVLFEQIYYYIITKLYSLLLFQDSGDGIPRVKPLKYAYEKEIVMYAYYQKLVYFSTECVFAPNAYRGHARVLLKDMEKIDPSIIMNIIHSGMSCIFNILY